MSTNKNTIPQENTKRWLALAVDMKASKKQLSTPALLKHISTTTTYFNGHVNCLVYGRNSTAYHVSLGFVIRDISRTEKQQRIENSRKTQSYYQWCPSDATSWPVIGKANQITIAPLFQTTGFLPLIYSQMSKSKFHGFISFFEKLQFFNNTKIIWVHYPGFCVQNLEGPHFKWVVILNFGRDRRLSV